MSEPYATLKSIQKPTDLHRLSLKELKELAGDVRQAILDNVSKTGGHLSSNLGTVELTVAMYAAYSVPPDKVIWDTGHQAYPHKLLTGRFERFGSLRQMGGISGFLRREENELDFFGAGHAGTAISAALGFAVARDRLGGAEKVVAVTGDASIGSGMSWEALNHAGEAQTDLCVVLNDNRMSIAPNVGALTNYLARLRSRPDFQGLARQAKKVIQKIPGPAPRIAAGLRHGITHYLAPEETGTLFEEMGFEYIGPVDGHDLATLLDVFRKIRELDYPVFVHALTVKGKGYEVAEGDSRKWHGVAPFDVSSAALPAKAGAPAYTQVFGDAITEVAKEDERVVAITAAMPDGTGLNRFATDYPKRFYDVGIAEQHAVTFAAGLAAGGLKPFCAIYSTFLQRAFDQVLHDVAIQNLPVRFVLDRGGLVGDDGPTHHGVFDHSYLACIPGIALMSPRDATELREMVGFMSSYDAGPIAVRYPRGVATEGLPEHRTPIQFGKAEVLGDSEGEALLIGCGTMVAETWAAKEELERQGVQATVVNVRFIKPFDEETLIGLARTANCIVTIEENVRAGGFGERFSACLVKYGLGHLPVTVLAVADEFVEHGAQSLLREQCGLTRQKIVESVQACAAHRSGRLR